MKKAAMKKAWLKLFVSLPAWVSLTAHHGDEEGHEEGDEEGRDEEGGHEEGHEETRHEETPLHEEGPQVSACRQVTRWVGGALRRTIRNWRAPRPHCSAVVTAPARTQEWLIGHVLFSPGSGKKK